MAKSSRASTKKANNVRLKANVFGPIESARQERLSAKLLELASQPKPVPEKEMEDATEKPEAEDKEADEEQKADDNADFRLVPAAMEIDTTAKSSKAKKGRVVKRRGRKSNIVFPKFGDRKTIKKKR